MSAPLQRAILLRERSRHEEAVAIPHQNTSPTIRKIPYAFVELALNRSEIPGQLKACSR